MIIDMPAGGDLRDTESEAEKTADHLHLNMFVAG